MVKKKEMGEKFFLYSFYYDEDPEETPCAKIVVVGNSLWYSRIEERWLFYDKTNQKIYQRREG